MRPQLVPKTEVCLPLLSMFIDYWHHWVIFRLNNRLHETSLWINRADYSFPNGFQQSECKFRVNSYLTFHVASDQLSTEPVTQALTATDFCHGSKKQMWLASRCSISKLLGLLWGMSLCKFQVQDHRFRYKITGGRPAWSPLWGLVWAPA